MQTTVPVMIHVRFAPDGSVVEIGERPPGASAQAWFNHLTRCAGTCFEALSGGRGIFRVPVDQIDSLKNAAPTNGVS